MRTMKTAGETQLDPGALGRWLDANGAPGSGEEPVLQQLKGGSQNTLYLIERGSSEARARMVLRMPGARADAARIDGLLREIRLVRALSGTHVPHAALIAADESGTVLGMPFYVMQAIDGGARWTADGKRRLTPTCRPAAASRSNSSRAPPNSAGLIGAPRA